MSAAFPGIYLTPQQDTEVEGFGRTLVGNVRTARNVWLGAHESRPGFFDVYLKAAGLVGKTEVNPPVKINKQHNSRLCPKRWCLLFFEI